MAIKDEANNVARNLMDDSVVRAERAAVYRGVRLFGRGELAAPFGFGAGVGVVAGAAATTTLPAGTTTVWSVLPTTIGIVVRSRPPIAQLCYSSLCRKSLKLLKISNIFLKLFQLMS